MAETSKIEWTDATWNPITGCSVISPGCTNCYAMRLAGTRMQHHPSRAGLTDPSKAGPVWNGAVRLNEEWLTQPLKWKRPRRIFVCAHGDLFHEAVPDAWIDKVFAAMMLAPQHTFQVLTKRAARMRAYILAWSGNWVLRLSHAINDAGLQTWADAPGRPLPCWPLPNVWLGVSAEDQGRLAERWSHLRATPAAVRFFSLEPLLGAIDATDICNGWEFADALQGRRWHDSPADEPGYSEATPRVDWVIVGGESGRGARPMHPDWARKLRDDCAAAGVPFFFKQWGEWIDVEDGLPPGQYRRIVVGSPEARTLTVGCDHPRWITRDGRVFKLPDDLPIETPGCLVDHRGKKITGRLLDGVEHNAMPERAYG